MWGDQMLMRYMCFSGRVRIECYLDCPDLVTTDLLSSDPKLVGRGLYSMESLFRNKPSFSPLHPYWTDNVLQEKGILERIQSFMQKPTEDFGVGSVPANGSAGKCERNSCGTVSLVLCVI